MFVTFEGITTSFEKDHRFTPRIFLLGINSSTSMSASGGVLAKQC
jgi:hypothetical protein